ncbi:uncharacterized protein EV422DRAFT_194606 [Fimicolochytrium jonesii]|uniref:uncharacterized protein n=1 Tax=Fimicolochytrium jonesii TaxID=1396493 RepID=UPI0022FE9B1F|nr:uncharacterized protein EV422DRAFT_194606 [Fimicolochytrium jonesii]KAI8818223.1 hypothetical protein EV422DRAFT_194606 [Fimicolochytrium jonesii]
MEEVDGINTSTFQQEEELRILIIGGGVAGLTTALAIKRIAAATGLNLRPIIFEADPAETAYTTNMAQHWILWKWAYDLLLELELGGRLSKIASAIHATRSIDADTRETLVAYPPDDEEVGGGAQDPEMGHRPTNNSGAPPMIGLRKMDLTRLLLQALGGIREDLIDGDKFVPSVPDTDSEGAQSDIAQTPTWFADEGYAELIPDLMLGYELDSFMVSANSGNVTARFMNGAVEYGFMIIGADGTHSKVRELLGTRRFSTPIQHAGAAVIHGITRLDNSYDDADHTGSLVSPVRTEDILRLCPDGNAVSLVGRGFAMGINNIGNGMLGWNLVVAQPTPHFHTTQFAAEKQAKAKAEAEAEDLRSGSPGPSSPFPKPRSSSSYFQVEHVTSDGVTEGSLPDPPPGGVSPARSVGSIDTLTDPVSNALGSLTLNGGLASASAPPSPSGSVSSVSSNRPRRSNRIETAFERQLRLQREDILAVKNAAEDAAAFGTSGATTEDPTTHMSGRNAKELAASLAARHASIPTTFLALIDRADPSLTHAMDILDLADEYMKSYTSPNFHPGRIIAIGDAAHPVPHPPRTLPPSLSSTPRRRTSRSTVRPRPPDPHTP